MSNEEMGEDASWKTHLDQLGQLPGTDGGWKEAAWDKLYARLQGGNAGIATGEKEFSDKKELSEEEDLSGEARRGKKRALWYWVAAAACIVPLFLLWQGSMRPGRQDLRIENRVGQEHPKVAAAGSSRKINPSGSKGINSPGSIEEKSSGKPILRGSRNPSAVSTTAPLPPVNLLAPGAAGSTPTTGPVIADGQTTITAPVLAVASSPAVKPKLRVVYINELGTAVKEEPIIGHLAGGRVFPLHLPFNDPSHPLLTGMETAVDPERESSALFKISLKN